MTRAGAPKLASRLIGRPIALNMYCTITAEDQDISAESSARNSAGGRLQICEKDDANKRMPKGCDVEEKHCCSGYKDGQREQVVFQ